LRRRLEFYRVQRISCQVLEGESHAVCVAGDLDIAEELDAVRDNWPCSRFSATPVCIYPSGGHFDLLDASLTTLLEGAGDRVGNRILPCRPLREDAALALLVDEEDRAIR
jgi:hypothetical protein